ncbi:hypothetical protein, partial [Mycobacteroides abscessus]|uniref:hypothetical protein n=1 Tax=Mycobacteroides abscessus TaxID=36809 RepID=UPI001A95D601
MNPPTGSDIASEEARRPLRRVASASNQLAIDEPTGILKLSTIDSRSQLTAEPPWFCRRLGLLDSDQGLGGPLGIVERRLILGG